MSGGRRAHGDGPHCFECRLTAGVCRARRSPESGLKTSMPAALFRNSATGGLRFSMRRGTRIMTVFTLVLVAGCQANNEPDRRLGPEGGYVYTPGGYDTGDDEPGFVGGPPYVDSYYYGGGRSYYGYGGVYSSAYYPYRYYGGGRYQYDDYRYRADRDDSRSVRDRNGRERDRDQQNDKVRRDYPTNASRDVNAARADRDRTADRSRDRDQQDRTARPETPRRTNTRDVDAARDSRNTPPSPPPRAPTGGDRPRSPRGR